MIPIPIPDITGLSDYFKDQIISTLSDVKDEVGHYFDNGVKPYLESLGNKFQYTKTFLHRLDNVNFYDIYFHINLLGSSQSIIKTNDIHSLLGSRQYLTIIGTAGSGKSMLIKHIFLSSIKEKIAVPIFIELRHLNQHDGTLIEYINEILLENRLSPNQKILERILRKGKFLFLFDGYDEVYSSKKEKVTHEISSFIDVYRDNKFVITSRPGANIELLPRFSNMLVNDLSSSEIVEFIFQQLKSYKKEGFEEIANRMKIAINDKDNLPYKSYLKNPLLLSMFILTFENNPEIPKNRTRFYSNVFNALCFQHNALSKHGFKHEKKSGLSNDQIENILKAFSLLTYFNGEYFFEYENLKGRLQLACKSVKQEYSFTIEDLVDDLVVSIPIIIKDGMEYKFPHRSLQEYFAASFISSLDIESKAKVYQEKLYEISRKSADSYSNFWQLCLEIDKSVFLEKFVLYNLQEFFTKVEANADTKEKIAVSILQFIDLELTLEFYLNPKYSSGDYSIIEDEIDEHEVEEGDYLKRTGVNLESGEVRESKWGEEFNFYKNLFKFLRFFQMYKITECPNPGDIIRFCDESIIYSQMKIGTGREGFGNPFYDNYDNSVNVSVNLNKSIKNLNDFVKSTGLDKELLAIYDDAKNKYDEIMLEIKSGIDLNNNLVMELLS